MSDHALFLSYAQADRKFAERLRNGLMTRGLATWIDKADIEAGSDWPQRVREAIREAPAILILVGPESKRDLDQEFTWREALEAVWDDETKLLVPILLPGARLPAFVVSGNGSRQFPAIRVHNKDAPDLAAQALADHVFAHRPRRRGRHPSDEGSLEILSPFGGGSAQPPDVSNTPATYPLPGDDTSAVDLVNSAESLREERRELERQREERLDRIGTYARQLRGS